MPSGADLIYDVGVANGDDSAYYLASGYRVVGIEANPALIPALENRFRAEIDSGRYHLLAVGISEAAGVAPFWVCDDQPELSSFSRSWAASNGARHHKVEVPTSNFASILERFGRAYYCKIDIEGNDHLCLRAISTSTRPRYISVEIEEAEREFADLVALGYRRFKLISQTSFRQPRTSTAFLNAHLGPLARRVAAHMQRGRGPTGGASWGPSGPFGEDTHGQWMSAERALALSRLLAADRSPADWFDIHAAD